MTVDRADRVAGAAFLTGPIFGAPQMAAHFDDVAFGRAMVQVACAFARVQGALGLIPAQAAEAIAKLEGTITPDPDDLAKGVAATGVPVPALVAQMRAAVGPDAADWVHWGATSQDIIDTAMMICTRAALLDLGQALSGVIDRLAEASDQYADISMVGRTRGQLATPITFGLRLANWAQPLIRLEAELDHLAQTALRVQSGGAAGAQTAIAPHGPAVADALADALGLVPAAPWHTDRMPIATVANWAMGIVTGLAKMAGDVALMSRGEVAELRAGAAGGSSTMPQKQNPVTAEAILALAKVAQGVFGTLNAAACHAEERDGAMWSVEWQLLPQLCVLTAAALGHAQVLADTLVPDAEAMRARIDAHPEVMSEAVVFALAPQMGRVAAQGLVKAAIADADPFDKALANRAPKGFDVAAALDPTTVRAPANAVRQQILATRKRP